MAKSKGDSIKSSYDLAMERLNQRDGKVKSVSAAQKARIAQVEAEWQARMAEIQIIMDPQIAAARQAGDADALRELEARKKSDMEKARTAAERSKQEARDA